MCKSRKTGQENGHQTVSLGAELHPSQRMNGGMAGICHRNSEKAAERAGDGGSIALAEPSQARPSQATVFTIQMNWMGPWLDRHRISS